MNVKVLFARENYSARFFIVLSNEFGVVKSSSISLILEENCSG